MVNLDTIIEKGKEFIGKEGGMILKAAGVGVLYYAMRKLGVDVAPGRGISLGISNRNGVEIGKTVFCGSNSSTLSGIEALYSAGKDSWSDSSKEGYAEKIVTMLENSSEIVDDTVKNQAIKYLTALSKACWSDSSKERILEKVLDVTEM